MLLLDASENEAALHAGVRRLLELSRGTVQYLAARLLRDGALSGAEVEAQAQQEQTRDDRRGQ